MTSFSDLISHKVTVTGKVLVYKFEVIHKFAYLHLSTCLFVQVYIFKLEKGFRSRSRPVAVAGLKAIDYDGLKCPNNSPVGCAASHLAQK